MKDRRRRRKDVWSKRRVNTVGADNDIAYLKIFGRVFGGNNDNTGAIFGDFKRPFHLIQTIRKFLVLDDNIAASQGAGQLDLARFQKRTFTLDIQVASPAGLIPLQKRPQRSPQPLADRLAINQGVGMGLRADHTVVQLDPYGQLRPTREIVDGSIDGQR